LAKVASLGFLVAPLLQRRCRREHGYRYAI
jgi:hypothetical protein